MHPDDDGIIDLHAIHREAQQANQEARASAAPSAPPPAVTLDSGPDLDDDEFAAMVAPKSRKRRVFAALGAAGALLVLGLSLVSLEDRDAKPSVAAAGAPAAPPPPATTSLPPAIADARPAPTTPAAATTGDSSMTRSEAIAKAAQANAASRKVVRPAASPRPAGGPKLMKVQSAGVPAAEH